MEYRPTKLIKIASVAMTETIFPDRITELSKEALIKIATETYEKFKAESNVTDDSTLSNVSLSEEDIVYVEDSPYAREWLGEHFKMHTHLEIFKAYCYIKFNTKTFDWSPTMEFQWLYVPQPKLEELESLLIFKN